jgi:chromosome segregation ATPase
MSMESAKSALALELPPAENEPQEKAATIPLRERDKTDRFAHDINAKIDALEVQMGHSTTLMERYQEFVKTALEDLRDRIMGVHNNAEEKLASNRQAIEAQHKTLNVLGEHVSNHSDNLDRQQSHIVTHSEQLGTLDQRQVDLQQMLVGLSQEHDSTVSKVNVLADQLYDADALIKAQQNTHHQTRKLVVALFGISALTLGGFGYFLFNPIAASTAVESQLATLNSDMAQQRASTANMSGELQRIGTGLTILEGDVAQIQNDQSMLLGNQHTHQEDINKLVAQLNNYESNINDLRVRLQRSLGMRSTLAVPVLKLYDRAWLASRPGDHFVIQLVGAYDYDAIVRFINKNATHIDKHPLSFNIVSYEGRDWHNLMYGDFANAQDAQAALNALPPELRTAKPWVRPLRTVPRNVR